MPPDAMRRVLLHDPAEIIEWRPLADSVMAPRVMRAAPAPAPALQQPRIAPMSTTAHIVRLNNGTDFTTSDAATARLVSSLCGEAAAWRAIAQGAGHVARGPMADAATHAALDGARHALREDAARRRDPATASGRAIARVSNAWRGDPATA